MVEKLKKYDVGLIDSLDSFFGKTLENKESSDGEFFKVEDVEPILNSLQQLKAEILPYVVKALDHCNNYGREAAIETLTELSAKLSAV